MLMEMLIQYQHQQVINSISEIEFVNHKNTFLPNKIEHTFIYVNWCIKKIENNSIFNVLSPSVRAEGSSELF